MFQTLNTLLRARAAEAEERLVDANDKTLLAQHLRDAKAEMAAARSAAARLIARKDAEDRRAVRLDEEIKQRENQARAAMTAGQDDLAGDIADRIASLEDQRTQARASAIDLERQITSLREGIELARDRIARLGGELRQAHNADLSRKTTRLLTQTSCGSALSRAEAMAERVRENSRFRDTITGAEQALCGNENRVDLDGRIAEAGLPTPATTRRTEILTRLTIKQGD